MNIAHCLGYLLDVRSWYIILETLQKIEIVIHRRVRAPSQQVEFGDIRQRVQDKLRDFNLSHFKASENATHQEEKKGEISRTSLNAKRGTSLSVSQQDSGSKTHARQQSFKIDKV